MDTSGFTDDQIGAILVRGFSLLCASISVSGEAERTGTILSRAEEFEEHLIKVWEAETS